MDQNPETRLYRITIDLPEDADPVAVETLETVITALISALFPGVPLQQESVTELPEANAEASHG